MTYRAIAYDPEVRAPRVVGYGTTQEEAKIDCLELLCRYLQQSVRWTKQGPFTIEVKEAV